MKNWIWLWILVTAALSFSLGWKLGRGAPAGEHARGAREESAAAATQPAEQPAPQASRAEPAAHTDSVPTAPEHAAVDAWSHAELRAHYIELTQRLADQQRELEGLRAAAEGLAATPAGPTEHPNPLKQRFYPLDREELRSLARNCSVRVDQPPMLDSTPAQLTANGSFADARPEERATMNRILSALHREFYADLRKQYEDAVGHAPNAELAPRTLLSEIEDKSGPGERGRVLAQITRERADSIAAPDPAQISSVYERAQREYFGLGDEFQRRLAEAIGPERAHQLRAENGGWPWQRSIFSGCEK